jgi:hypothetical protein
MGASLPSLLTLFEKMHHIALTLASKAPSVRLKVREERLTAARNAALELLGRKGCGGVPHGPVNVVRSGSPDGPVLFAVNALTEVSRKQCGAVIATDLDLRALLPGSLRCGMPECVVCTRCFQ